jgi:hypothetical protein
MGIRDTRHAIPSSFPSRQSEIRSGAIARDVVLSGIPAQVPVLEMTNTSDPSPIRISE